MKLVGTVSHFGGPADQGVAPDEGLAFIYDVDQAPELFLPWQPDGTTGLARRLDPRVHYIATRWDYDITPKDQLLKMLVLVRAPATGKIALARPADWGPAGPESDHDTGRIADISPGLMRFLGIETDDEIEVIYSDVTQPDLVPMSVVISSGHAEDVRGASGLIDEVDEARKVVPRVAKLLRELGIEAIEFHDDTSTTQNENLETICDFHNQQIRDLDVSVHFNAATPTDDPRGTECYAISQMELAGNVSEAISSSGNLIDRGARDGSGLYFLNHTDEGAILIEVCFVDSSEDVEQYEAKFNAICAAIAGSIASWLLT